MSGPTTPRPVSSDERDLVSQVFGFGCWRDMAVALTAPVRRRAPAPGIESPRAVVRARSGVAAVRRRAWTPSPHTRLPSAEAIVAACAQVIVPIGDHDILIAVRDLAMLALHEHTADPREPISPTQVAFQHDQLIATLDRLTTDALPTRPRRTVVVHTEPLTEVIDRLVTLAVTREVIEQQPATPESRQLDVALADLMTGYDQLIADLVTGRRRLPRHQHVPAT